MKNKKVVLVFVHGWSVTNTNTYGALPERLVAKGREAGLDISIKQIYLGHYISFHDEVLLSDVSLAFEIAVKEQLANIIKEKVRFVCITHSTGGPVIRDWWNRFYFEQPNAQLCPMSHLIMLAPANYGSALAQLGKGRLSRMKSWFDGVEPGQGILNWLELGSDDAWQLNTQWIATDANNIGEKGIFPFVLTGQSIDHQLYDNLNTYTGESGSDGVVRVAAANLQGQYIRLEQEAAKKVPKKTKNSASNRTTSIDWQAPELKVVEIRSAPPTALKVIPSKSHSGKTMGIMRSVKKSVSDKSSEETIQSILACVKVNTRSDYQQVTAQFDQQTRQIQKQQKLETVKHLLLPDTHFIHDKYSMVIFKIRDLQGYPVRDFDLILTAGEKSDPNLLPKGFFVDKQRNLLSPNTITYYFNHDLMQGSDEVVDPKGKVIRAASKGAKKLGFKLIPRPGDGFVHYLPCEILASETLLEKSIRPNTTTLVEICLQRVVHKNVMGLDKGVKTRNFKSVKPSAEII